MHIKTRKSKKLNYESDLCATDSNPEKDTPNTFIESEASSIDLANANHSVEISTIIFTLDSDNRPHLEVSVKNRQVIGLIDTGSQVTAIGNNSFKKIDDWGDELLPFIGKLRMAD